MLFFFIFFEKNFLNFFLFLGLAKSFFQKKYAFNFFFNYDFNAILERVFSFFSLILLNFRIRVAFFFNILFDDLFSNFNIIFFSNNFFNLDLSSVRTASHFFNQIIIYNY